MPQREELRHCAHGPVWPRTSGPSLVKMHGPVWVKTVGPSWVKTMDQYSPKDDNRGEAGDGGTAVSSPPWRRIWLWVLLSFVALVAGVAVGVWGTTLAAGAR
jgi:hypothetical protein